MKAVLQRVKEASVTANGAFSGAIGQGLLILLGVMEGDTEGDARLLADKIAKMRIFSDVNGKMNLSVCDVGGGALVVSNFTLAANYRKGNRPDYLSAAKPTMAESLYLSFISYLKVAVPTVESGVFGADMQIDLTADGPVTITMDSAELSVTKNCHTAKGKDQ